MLIPITITNRIATVDGAHVIVCGNSDYRLAFTFDEEWNSQTVRTARFVYIKDGELKSYDVAFHDTEVTVPRIIDTKEVFIGVYAGGLYTTTPARVPCAQSILCLSAEPDDLTPSQYEQIIALINAGLDASSVKYYKQTPGPEQQAQARENIDVYSKTESDNKLTAHNVNTEAHNDIRLALKTLSDRLNAVLNSDDSTLDDLNDIVAYIKDNKDLIDEVTTNKVNITDIVNNLTTNVANKPLSAAQGVVLNALITELTAAVAGKAPAYTYGTDDIIAGSASTYPTGTLHFVYT